MNQVKRKMNFFGQNRLQFLTSFLEIDAFSDDYYIFYEKWQFYGVRIEDP